MDTGGNRAALASSTGAAVGGSDDVDGSGIRAGAIAGNGETGLQMEEIIPVPIIEMATYAETDVFECYVRGFESRIVMRRKHDDWINITQVFKIAKFSKTQRTKVLEKESSDMENEKVQGGYGRFQGTWIPLDKAKYMVNKYNIRDPVVNKILEFELDPNNPPVKRSKNSVLKRSSPNGRISSPSSYNKTPKKKNQANSSSLSRKTKKNSIHLQPNPSPLHNVVFQTPQQVHTISANNATTISAMSNNNESSNEKELNMSQINSNETPLTMNYSATQKPLQFYPVPTNLTHPQKLSRDKPHLINFIPDGPNQGVFASQQLQAQRKSALLDNDSMRHVGKKRKKGIDNTSLGLLENGINENHNEHLDISSKNKKKNNHNYNALMKGNSMEKSHYKMKKQQQTPWQNFRGGANNNPPINSSSYQNYVHRNNHSNTSSLEMFSTHEDPTPMSSRSASPNDYNGIPTAPATAIDNGEGIQNGDLNGDMTQEDNNVLTLEEYKELILQVLSSEDGSSKDYALPPQMYHPPPNLDINFEIDDQGHTPLHWATAMANVPLIKLLIALNANALQCNSRGFNCITKSTFYNNCFKAASFGEVSSVLRICLITPDSNGRLPLHYLVELSVNKSKDPVVINSYMDTVIQNLGQEDYTLLRMCLNFQDNAGNTALHLAALNMNLELCNKLCYLGSSMDVTNYDNDTPASILAKFNLVPPTSVNSFSTPQFVKNHKSSTSTFLEAPVATTPGISLPRSRENLRSDKTNKVSRNADDDNGKNENRDVDKENRGNFVGGNNEFIQKDHGILRSTPYISSKKTASRNFLSGGDTTTFTTLMDDLSNIDSFVTSSVLKDIKSTPSKPLEDSPILFRKRDATATESNTNNDATLSTVLKKPVDISGSLDSPLAAIVATPLGTTQNSKAITGVLSSANRLREISNSLVISINSEISKLKTETSDVEVGLDGVKQNLEITQNSEKELLSQFEEGIGFESVQELQGKTEQLRQLVDNGKNIFMSCVEKSQALNLATFVQEEESKVNSDTSNSPSPISPRKDQIMKSLRLATELGLLQFKRRLKLNKISDARCNVNLSSKVTKYRRLIGMTVENIDSKLDEIEMDLRAPA